MKFLVTGGAGFIGSNIVDQLILDGHHVLVIDNESSDAHDQFYWNDLAENYNADISSYEDIRRFFDGVDIVFHLAAEARIQPAIQNPLLAVRTNSLGTATVLQCAREAAVKRVIYSSTSSAYGKNNTPNVETQPNDCLNPYSVSKVSGEELCKMYYSLFGLETIIFRYFNVYGPREPMRGSYAPVVGIFKRQKDSGLPLTIVGDGDQRRDFTHVDDVVKANILAANSQVSKELLGSVFNVGTGINYSINDIARMYDHEIIYINKRPGESRNTLANIEKTKSVFGWYPTKKVEDYIHDINQ